MFTLAFRENVIDISGEIIRCIPDNEIAWHAGQSYGPQWNEMARTNNSRFIGIECCHPDSSGQFSTQTYKALLGLCVYLCRTHNLNPNMDIFRHYDVCGKNCPVYYVNNPDKWGIFKTEVSSAVLAEPNTPSAWAAEAWAWAATNGINDGTRPKDAATREEVTTIVHRLFKTFISKN